MGKMPEWIDLWMLSCSKNEMFDFLLVTDQNVQSHYSNVLVLHENLDQLRSRFSSALGFSVCLPRPYKLCDFKPLYALAFTEIVDKYDFWGHCDLDQIFGNLSTYITKSILINFDVVGNRGHLMLYRNTKHINNLYKCKGSLFSYRKVFTNPESYNFDEMGGMCRIIEKSGTRWYKDVHAGNSYTKYQRFYAPNGKHVPEIYVWKNGHVYRASYENAVNVEEFSYFHFSSKYPKVKMDNNVNNYYLTSEKFEQRLSETFTKDEILSRTEYISEKDDKMQFIKGIRGKLKKLRKQTFRQRMVNLYFNIVFKLGL